MQRDAFAAGDVKEKCPGWANGSQKKTDPGFTDPKEIVHSPVRRQEGVQIGFSRCICGVWAE